MSDHIYIAQGVGNLFGAGLVGLGLYAHVDPLYSMDFLLSPLNQPHQTGSNPR